MRLAGTPPQDPPHPLSTTPTAQMPHARSGQRARAISFGAIAAAALVILIAIGSRGFHWFDAALIGYAVGTIFALAAITYKYTFWLMRPQTGRYFWRSWRLFFSFENFRRYTALIPSAIVSGLFTQGFIRRRGPNAASGFYRWATHQCIFWGVVLSCSITFPLTFGWLRFTQTTAHAYRIWVFGFAFFAFDPQSVLGFLIYHALVLTSIPLLVGLILAFHRRFHDLAQISIQRFSFDIMPLALLFAIVISGLALTVDSTFYSGAYYHYISLTHEAIVVFWLISLPFGKFFHILERPATVGIELYWRTGEDTAQHACPRCGEVFASQRFIQDLKRTTFDIGQNYTVAAGAAQASPSGPREAAVSVAWWQDFCPACKRIMRAEANLGALGHDGNRFL
ncbi:MAG: MFS transporter [Ktedonobacterales bacterium]